MMPSDARGSPWVLGLEGPRGCLGQHGPNPLRLGFRVPALGPLYGFQKLNCRRRCAPLRTKAQPREPAPLLLPRTSPQALARRREFPDQTPTVRTRAEAPPQTKPRPPRSQRGQASGPPARRGLAVPMETPQLAAARFRVGARRPPMTSRGYFPAGG